MAGGVKKPVNVFRLGDLGEPKGVFNWRLWLAVITFGLMGASRGVDEGVISGAFNSKDFQKYIGFDNYSESEQTNIRANVTAMVQIGCVGGALIAFTICDKIGRLWAARQLCLVWMLGIAIFMGNNGNLGAVYAGRFIAGLGIGQTAVVGPIYIAEISPASIRGICTSFFSGSVYLGIVTANFANYGCQVNMGQNTHARWLVPISVHLMFAGLIFCLSFFSYESPRYLVEKGKVEEATRVMARLRNLSMDDDYIVREISHIQLSFEQELEASKGVSFFGKIKELLTIRTNLYCLYLASVVQILGQWSGAGSVTVYATDLFQLLGVTNKNTNLLLTSLFGVVKLFAAISCAFFLIEVIGRKRSLMLGMTLQTISMIYVAAFLTAYPRVGDEGYDLPGSASNSARGAIAMIWISGIGFVLGWNTMSYVLTAEIFPLRVRALATSWVMMLHFVAQYAVTRATPNMLLPVSQGGITSQGTFWFFGGILALSLVWVYFTIPETAGRSLEDMHRLFELPWYKIGTSGNKYAEEMDEREDEKVSEFVAKDARHVEMVEKA